MSSTSSSAAHLLELCQQYFIAGWLSSAEYEYYRQEIQTTIPMNMNHHNHKHSNDLWKALTQRIQQSISKTQQQQKWNPTHPPSVLPVTSTSTGTTSSRTTHTTTKSSADVSTSPPPHPVIYTPAEFQQWITSSNHGSGSTPNLKELFVEMCFYARLGYIQPPCCLHCTYTDCYSSSASPVQEDDDRMIIEKRHTMKSTKCSKSTQQSNIPVPLLCHRFVIWRKDTNIILHPDTMASNILILPCYLARQLLNVTSTQEPSTMTSVLDASTQYRYDPIHTTIVLK
jgi:hypothetical protein